ncbi:fibroin heavy chain-like [Spodoptera frugiperda]|uniref:Fibroin heavy chain-like n=1 Tax=Spodoptera frugiperda TaxID=7108 RepID=A0A9R0DCA1_SPOFR|nr:fibroin heavy chain-like [Spodoptera frugiperda]
MAAKFIVLATILAACNALPVWYNAVPAVVIRSGRSPSVSYGFGSGFSSNIGGISHSTGIGASFQSGDGEAYGAGIGSSNGGYARGVGIASAGNSQPVQYQRVYQAPQPAYESAVASAQNFGGYGNAVSSAQSLGGNGFGSAVSSAQSGGLPRFNSAVSSAQNVNGYGSALSSANSGYGSALSSAQNSGFGSSVSSAQTRGLGYGSAVSAAENIGGYGASTAQVVQQRSGGIQHSGATSINAPGLQAAHSHAVNSGFY